MRARNILFALAVLALLGASATVAMAACSDLCPAACPFGDRGQIDHCNLVYDAKGVVLSGTCYYTCGDSCAKAVAGTDATKSNPPVMNVNKD